MSGTRRMPGGPSRFPARGTMAAGRIRAAAGRSAAAGVPTRVTLCHVRMMHWSGGWGRADPRPADPPQGDGWGRTGPHRSGQRRPGAQDAGGRGGSRADAEFAPGGLPGFRPDLVRGRPRTTRAILLIPATWPAVGAAPSLAIRGTVLGRMVVGRRLSLGGLAVLTGRAGPGLRGAVGRIPTSRLTAARPAVAGRTLSPGAVLVRMRQAGPGGSGVVGLMLTSWLDGPSGAGADEPRRGPGADGAGGTGQFRRGRAEADYQAYGPGPDGRGQAGPGAVVLPTRRAGLGSSAAVGRRPMSWPTAPSPAAVGCPSRGGLAAAVRLRRPGISGVGVARRPIRRLAADLAAPSKASHRVDGAAGRPGRRAGRPGLGTRHRGLVQPGRRRR